MASGPLLAFDTGSPVVSVALALPDRVDVLSTPQGRSSRDLIAMIDELLAGAGVKVRELEAIAAARGPGSFTGLRVGLATATGLWQAAGVRTGTLPTFELLAAHYAERTSTPAPVVLAVVDAHHDRWFTRPMRFATDGRARADGPPEIRCRNGLERSGLPVVGHRTCGLDLPAGVLEATELAPTMVRRMQHGEFTPDPATLAEPLYLRPPATSSPRRAPGSPRPVRRSGSRKARAS